MTSVRDPTRWRPKKKPSLGNGRCAKDRFPECHRCRRFAWSPTPGQTSHWQTLVSNVFGLPRPCGSTHADNSSSRSTPKLSSAASARYSRTRRGIGVHIHQIAISFAQRKDERLIWVRLPRRSGTERCRSNGAGLRLLPGIDPGEGSSGTAATFEAARVGFEVDWLAFLPTRTKAEFQDLDTETAPPAFTARA